MIYPSIEELTKGKSTAMPCASPVQNVRGL